MHRAAFWAVLASVCVFSLPLYTAQGEEGEEEKAPPMKSVLLGTTPPRTSAEAIQALVCAQLEFLNAAQGLYFRNDFDKDAINEFAQSLRGNNSLYEKTAGAGDLTLIARDVAYADDGFKDATPFHGYLFRILKGQGAHAPGGKKSYEDEKGNLSGGFALLAYPQEYAAGTHTFLLSSDGNVYGADLGPITAKIVKGMNALDLDPKYRWFKVRNVSKK